jgi:hypothetical protein
MMIDKLIPAMYGGGTTDALNRVPTPIYGPLKRAQDALAVLLARLGFHHPKSQGFSPSQGRDPL